MSIGSFVANVGHALHLPELGISEKLGGTNTYTAVIDGKTVLGQGKTYQDFLNSAQNYVSSMPTNNTSVQNATDGASTGVYGDGSSSAGSANNDFLIQNQLDRLPGQQDVGMKNILDSYTSAFQTLMNQKATTMRDYQTSRDQTQQDNVTAKNNIDAGVRSNVSALARLLGAKGAGNSSAALILAPFAAARLGNSQRADVQTAYGRNMSSLDTSEGDANNSFDTAFGQLNTDRGNKENSLRQGILDTRAKLLAAKGDPSLQGTIGDLGHQVDALGAVQSFVPKAVNAATPDLAKYQYATPGAPTASDTLGGGADGALPGLGAYSVLLGLKKQQQQQNLAAAA
jgi:hypothetical protein